jgi:hypothetical protein
MCGCVRHGPPLHFRLAIEPADKFQGLIAPRNASLNADTIGPEET